MSNIVPIEPRPALEAGARPSAIVPTNFESAYRLANAVCQAGMAPKGLDTPEKALVAILHGLEIGLTPMAALQRIAVVNGRPTIWGDGAIGLVRGSGACEYVRERIDGDGDKMVAICEAKRKGEPEPIIGRFSVQDAKTASLWNKSGPWQQYPRRMLQMRARAFALRDGFADVLGGLYLREEIEDDRDHVQSRRAPAPSDMAAIEHKPSIEAEPIIVKESEVVTPVRRAPAPQELVQKQSAQEAEIVWTDVLADYKGAAEAAQDTDALDAAFSTFISPRENDMPKQIYEMACAIDDQVRGRLE